MRILYLDIDTLRADHLGCAGYERNATPNIDALAADGVRFANVYASDVPCLPSRTALITGTFGIRNGVVNHGGAAATWWNAGFTEAMNLMRGMGAERADEVLPGALDWLDRRGRADDWFLHVHLWDPHTPYNAPAEYGNPFGSDPVPAWHTEEVRVRNWGLSGPHSAQEPWGFTPDEWGPPGSRQPWDANSMDVVKGIFDGYDSGVRYADDALGVILNKLADLGVLDDTAILVSSDHGEAFGELGVYADHQAADEATCHIPAVLRWPGLQPAVHDGLQYHLDIATTLVELAGLDVPRSWDGRPVQIGGAGRDHLVVSQGAWSCQRGVRWGDHLYLRTWHDGYHGHWNEEMLFDITVDPHETTDLAAAQPETKSSGAEILEEWTSTQLQRTGLDDPMDTVRAEGGPYHVRRHLPAYLQRLRTTGRSHWAHILEQRHAAEL